MQNLVIINNNINYIHDIIGKISELIDNVKLYNFFTNDDTNIFNIINNKNADIFIITFNNKTIKFLDYLTQNNIKFYKKSIILLYNDINAIKKLLNENYAKYIFKCIKISNNKSSLIKNLRNLVYIKENTYEKTILYYKIEKNLLKLGFNKKNIGTKYIIEIIEYLSKNKMDKFELNKIYKILMKKHNKNFNTIKGSIQFAKNKMLQNVEKDTLLNYFDYLDLEKYPTVKEIISTTIEKL